MSTPKTTKPLIDEGKMDLLHQEISHVVQTLDASGRETYEQLAEKMVTAMQIPTWQLVTHNTLSGRCGYYQTQVEAVITFSLDIETLLSDPEPSQDSLAQVQTIATNDSEADSHDLAALVTQGLLPQAVGVSNSIKVVAMKVLDSAGKQVAQSLSDHGVVFMEVQQEGVLLDYSQLLVALDNQQQPLYQLDQELFKHNVFVALDLFRLGKPFSHSFTWADQTGGNDVQLAVKLEGAPL